MYIDIDNFKIINDSLGHDYGDELLKLFAIRTQETLREEDTFARLGGDEFAVILEELQNHQEAEKIAGRILANSRRPFMISGNSYFITVSIGVTFYPEHALTSQDLIKNADSAMYLAKRDGKDKIRFFTKDLQVLAERRLELENQLRQAILENQFRLYYQPVVDVPADAYAGVEVLLRWEHPEEGILSPDAFMPVLEETGLIREVGRIVIKKAFEETRKLLKDNIDMFVSINFSPSQFYDEGLLDYLDTLFTHYEISPRQVVIEITEDALIEDLKNFRINLEKANRRGIRIAIDDFGKGHSSMMYIQELPIQILKIDKSFVDKIRESPDSINIIKTITALGENLKLDVIIEGVETKDQLDLLQNLSLRYYQGFYFAKPLPVQKFISLMKNT